MPFPVDLPPSVFTDPAGRIPPAYMASLAKHESSFNPLSVSPSGSHATGLYQVTQIALSGYNERNGTHHTLEDMLDSSMNKLVAADHLNLIMSQWAARHGNRIVQDWNDPEWLALLTYGYNAGHNGISLIVNSMPHHLPVTVDNVARFAPDTRWGRLLRNPDRIAFAKAVARDAFNVSQMVDGSAIAQRPSGVRPIVVAATLLAALGVGVIVAMETSRAQRDSDIDEEPEEENVQY